MRPLVRDVVVAVVAIVLSALVTAFATIAIVNGSQPECEDLTAHVAVDHMRPAFHYTPQFGWVNDPNGLVYYEGEWHLFYQYDYETTLHGNMSWGHAVSTDLARWKELGVALSYDEKEQLFSGSAVIDASCTSGLCAAAGQPVMVAIYTSYDQAVDPNSPVEDGVKTQRHFQSQHVASSTDKGRTWTKYAGNPVLDKRQYEFRDPKVSRQGDHWLMLVQMAEAHQLQFYKSTDLIHWGDGKGGDGPAGTFGPVGHTGGVWECPDMFKLPVDGDEKNAKWVLIVNINPGNRFGGYGSAAQYFLGDFDGDKFVAETESTWLDWGADNYATITWDSAPNDEKIAIGWMSNWNYTQIAPASTWRNAFTVPRRLELATVDGAVRLLQNPVNSIDSLRDVEGAFHLTNVALPADNRVHARAADIVVEFEAGTATEFGVKVHAGTNQETLVGYDKALGEVFVDRRMSGTVNFDPRFPDRHSVALPLTDGKLKLRILVDHGSVEVFANRGEVAITDVVFPDPSKNAISFYATGGAATLLSATVYKMDTVHGLL